MEDKAVGTQKPDVKKEENALGQSEAQDNQRHLDFLISLILIGVSIAVIVTCQGYYHQQLSRRIVTQFYESTGFMPTVFASFLLVMALIQLAGSLRRASIGAYVRQLICSAKATLTSRRFYKAVGGLLIFAVYVYVLLGRLSFGTASFLVLFVTLMYTHLEKRWQTWLRMGLIALCASAGIVLLFQYAFSVPMP